ncbi:ABC transporter ATP-binding protein [Clostridium grantii]|uniref:ABC-2 type transport system ATP-binding protein n=1 Tax=Clostridium grantii DSM 8605 TaxID=1121316 RepID=A0A1M5QGL6_9CLOT|nr:ABC transporter ATP-binding protein [Clostridium grantii]SHH12909.1 ABC-2 type transport system ATP-binding protein [Clostridium grantii DSM 8605]
MENMLEIINLSKNFGDFKLDNINITLEKGSIMGFIGENGAGKTSTIKLILNAIAKNSGEINILGKDNIKDEELVKSCIGYVPDEDYFILNSTLKNHAKALKIFYDNWDNHTFLTFVKKWELPLNKKISEFSKGMKTKAMLSLAFAHNPKLLILDEPTAGLDPMARIEVLDLLRDFVSDGEKSVFFSTHITSDLDKVADFVTLINNGKILDSLSIDKLEEKYLILNGGLDVLNGLEKEFVGIKKGEFSFEGLISRDKANLYFKDLKGSKPNIENFLTFSIWGEKNEKVI